MRNIRTKIDGIALVQLQVVEDIQSKSTHITGILHPLEKHKIQYSIHNIKNGILHLRAILLGHQLLLVSLQSLQNGLLGAINEMGEKLLQ